MSINNDVYQVLVTKDNLAPLAAGSALTALAPGQIGVFDRNTHLAIDGTAPVREFYLAVGVDRDNDTVIEDVNRSAGQAIQTRNISYYSFRPHTAAQPMIVEVTDIKADCNTEYAIKLEFRNQEVYRRQGYNQFTKTYAVKTPCCEGCDPCPTGDCNQLVKLMVEAINADAFGLVVAEAIDGPGGAVIADIDAFIATNAAVNSDADPLNDVCASIRLTTVPQKVNAFCNVNLRYFHPRQTIIIPTLVEGFGCSGTVTITQETAFEEGSGYDVQQKEYKAGGWNGRPGPYRQSSVTGMAFNVEYFADAAVKYDQFALTYNQFSVGGWQEYLNNLATIVAIPETDTVTRDGLVAILDPIVAPAGFDALADDVALANVDPLVVEPTTDIDDVNLDGIA